ncbi:MAG: RHS repeat domain-containing protein [Bradymonadaceae bacterium]
MMTVFRSCVKIFVVLLLTSLSSLGCQSGGAAIVEDSPQALAQTTEESTERNVESEKTDSASESACVPARPFSRPGEKVETVLSELDSRLEWRACSISRNVDDTLERVAEERGLTYDEDGRLIRIDFYDVTFGVRWRVDITYDDRGRISSLLHDDGHVLFHYDECDNLVAGDVREGADGDVIERIEFRFDEFGRQVAIDQIKPSGTRTETFSYDDEHRLIEVTSEWGSVTTYKHESERRVVRRYPDQEDSIIEFNEDGRVVRNGQTAFVYDANGRLVEERDESILTTYSYDSQDRVVEVIRTFLDDPDAVFRVYSVDYSCFP